MLHYLVVLAACLSASVNASEASVEDVKAGLKDISDHPEVIERRDRNLTSHGQRMAAMALGTQAAAKYEAERLNKLLIEKYGVFFDTLFRFERILIKRDTYSILPPVILRHDGAQRVNRTAQVFRVNREALKIQQDPRFVISPPSWREYLLLPVGEVDYASAARLAPTDSAQQEAWDRAVDKGWDAGIELMERTLTRNYAKLVRDFQGMVRYHVLRKLNIVSDVQIQEVYTPVAGGGKRISISESIATIEVSPTLNTNRFEWKALPLLPDLDDVFPRGVR